MKTAGVLILVLGLILVIAGIGMVVGSVFMVQSAFQGMMESRVVKTIPLTVDQSVTSEPIEVSTEKKCQIAVQADLTGTDVKENKTGPDTTYQLDYSIPFEVEVFDDAGKSIHSEKRTLTSSGFVMTHNRAVDEDGGSETPRIMLGTFPAPASGKLSVTAKIGKNQGRDIEIQAAQVDVVDNVSASAETAASGVGMCCGGPAVAGFGVLLLIIGAIVSLVGRSGPAPPPGMPPGQRTG
ncbi:MAG TPA: hypothetical protein VMP01_07315 [Pirellulaceae bacterium]|nr:hypothetical protein [Pirellulaceae bacterium]